MIVDKVGTETAAASYIMVEGASPYSKPPDIEMIVDRPFLFFLRDRESKTNLFTGVVKKLSGRSPKKAEMSPKTSLQKPKTFYERVSDFYKCEHRKTEKFLSELLVFWS